MARFGIYQTSDRRWAFMDWQFAEGHGFDFKCYSKVYELELDGDLNDVFEKLNVDRPADYRARSLSVSDIIEVNGKFFYVDDFGFKAIAA